MKLRGENSAFLHAPTCQSCLKSCFHRTRLVVWRSSAPADRRPRSIECRRRQASALRRPASASRHRFCADVRLACGSVGAGQRGIKPPQNRWRVALAPTQSKPRGSMRGNPHVSENRDRHRRISPRPHRATPVILGTRISPSSEGTQTLKLKILGMLVCKHVCRKKRWLTGLSLCM